MKTGKRAELAPGPVTVPAGAVSECLELRPDGDKLRACGAPRLLERLQDRPLFADVMEGRTWIFTQEDDGTLYARPVPEEGEEPVEPVEVARLERAVVEGAAAGPFVIFRLEDGSLVYLRREAGEGRYTWLGALPQLPAFTLTAEKGVAMSVEMEGVRFPTALKDLSNPVPPEVATRVWQAWVKAWSRLEGDLRGAGRWTEPVRVRVAMRLWDGTLLSVSEPVRVTPPVRAARDRMQVGVLWSESAKAFTGTDTCTLSAHGYTITLTWQGEIPAQWQGIVSGFELWVSREPATLDGDRVPSVSFIHDDRGNYVSFIPAARPTADIDADAAVSPLGLLRFQECPCPATLRLLRAEPAAWDSAVEGYVTPMPGNMLEADCILGYGEFLHVGADDSLYTSRRGNPFVLRDVTVGMGGRVRSLRPQRCGGGAFTRQYIYASTDRGLTALCHKADGGHTNCRPVCQEPLGRSESWCSTPRGVYALTAQGSLLCLRDAAAPVALTGLKGDESLLWSNVFAELWICSDTGCRVMGEGGLHTRTLPAPLCPVPGVFSPSLACLPEEDGHWRLLSLDREEPTQARRVFECELTPAEGSWLRRMLISMNGSGMGYEVRDPLCGVLACGTVGVCIRRGLALTLPLSPGRRTLKVRLEGDIQELGLISII